MSAEETVPCRLCGQRTPYTGTKLCHRCWELERRVQMDPDIARKVLPAMGDDAGSDATVEALRARLSELEGVLRYVGKQLTSADLGDHNCASWDVCNKRLRNLGKRALAACAAHKPLDTSDDVG